MQLFIYKYFYILLATILMALPTVFIPVLLWLTWSKSTTPIPVAERSKAWVCCRSPAGIAGSNPAEGMDVCCECSVFVR
jgi:hypothetical protein